MLIEANGSKDMNVTGVVLTSKTVYLDNNQFFMWAPSGKQLELWKGKDEFLEESDPESKVRKISTWQERSVITFI